MKTNLLKLLSFRVPNRSTSVAVAFNLLLAAFIVIGIRLDNFPLVMLLVTAFEAYRVWIQGEGFLYHAVAQSPFWLASLSLPMILVLNPRLITQLVLATGFVVWRITLRNLQNDDELALPIGAVSQLVALTAIFAAAAIYRLSGFLVIVMAWIASWVVATRTLEAHGERAAKALASTWALLVAECSWVFTLWLVVYVLPGGFVIIPQPAVVLTALGYCLAGIYASHRRSQLSRRRLVEYLIVGLMLMGIVIAGTKWNGVI